VNIIEASPHDPGTAYVAANRYQLDDVRPYIFKTTDYGTSWQQITSGIPERSFVRTVREDPARRDLLFAGAETGVYYSLDGGTRWQSLQLNLPAVPITDLAIKNDDLIAATQGRSFGVLDDITPLHTMSDTVTRAAAHLSVADVVEEHHELYTSSHFATESFSAFTSAALVPRDVSIASPYSVLLAPATPQKKFCESAMCPMISARLFSLGDDVAAKRETVAAALRLPDTGAGRRFIGRFCRRVTSRHDSGLHTRPARMIAFER
jgi:hypothetical protein